MPTPNAYLSLRIELPELHWGGSSHNATDADAWWGSSRTGLSTGATPPSRISSSYVSLLGETHQGGLEQQGDDEPPWLDSKSATTTSVPTTTITTATASTTTYLTPSRWEKPTSRSSRPSSTPYPVPQPQSPNTTSCWSATTSMTTPPASGGVLRPGGRNTATFTTTASPSHSHSMVLLATPRTTPPGRDGRTTTTAPSSGARSTLEQSPVTSPYTPLSYYFTPPKHSPTPSGTTSLLRTFPPLSSSYQQRPSTRTTLNAQPGAPYSPPSSSPADQSPKVRSRMDTTTASVATSPATPPQSTIPTYRSGTTLVSSTVLPHHDECPTAYSTTIHTTTTTSTTSHSTSTSNAPTTTCIPPLSTITLPNLESVRTPLRSTMLVRSRLSPSQLPVLRKRTRDRKPG